MMLKITWFCIYIFKYLFVAILISGGIVWMVSPSVGGIVFLLCILGAFRAAWDEASSDIDAENEGFEEALRQIRRNLM